MSNRYKLGATLPPNISRREILRTTGAGFGALALAGMLASQSPAADQARKSAGPLAPKAPHFAAKAKRIIFLFLEGAFSQLDTWEYKPALQAGDGKAGPGGGTLVASKFKFSQHGQNGHLGIGSFSTQRQARGQALLSAWPAHRHGRLTLKPSCSCTPAQQPCHADSTLDGRLVAVWTGHRESRLARLYHDQPTTEFRWCRELRQRFLARSLSRHAHHRQRISAEPASQFRSALAAQNNSTSFSRSIISIARCPALPTNWTGLFNPMNWLSRCKAKFQSCWT